MKKDFAKSSPAPVLFSVIYYVYFFCATLLLYGLLSLIYLVVGGYDPQKRFAQACTRYLAYHLFAVNPAWRASFEGLEHIQKGYTYVFVANHQSLADVLVLSRINALYKWVAKSELHRMVGVGHLMRFNDFISVHHGDLRTVRRMIKDGTKWLRQGVSLFIFPEGRRSPSGDLVEFKEGPFRLACDTATMIVPIAIDGTRHLLPLGRWVLNLKGDVRVRVLPPVNPADFNYDSAAVKRYVRSQIHSALDEMRGVSSDAVSTLPSTVV